MKWICTWVIVISSHCNLAFQVQSLHLIRIVKEILSTKTSLLIFLNSTSTYFFIFILCKGQRDTYFLSIKCKTVFYSCSVLYMIFQAQVYLSTHAAFYIIWFLSTYTTVIDLELKVLHEKTLQMFFTCFSLAVCYYVILRLAYLLLSMWVLL